MVDTGWTSVLELISWFGGAKNVGPRIQQIRESRREKDGRPAPWTQERLAQEMTAKLPGDKSMSALTIWKIENPDKPSANRAITVDELLLFAEVLNVTIADLLLPGEHVSQLAAYKAVVEAAEQLQEVREAWSRYTHAIRAARARVAASADASYDLKAELSRTRDDHYKSFADQHARHGFNSSLEEFAQGQPPTPLLAAMEDTLGPLDVNMWGWADQRHALPVDADEAVLDAVREARDRVAHATDFTYSGGA